ncbi:MAG TPA: hypothetical protein VNO70_17860 [Blastocatellia bacterium]|nr:hypothetical protein [Blastocatellia bacterium]
MRKLREISAVTERLPFTVRVYEHRGEFVAEITASVPDPSGTSAPAAGGDFGELRSDDVEALIDMCKAKVRYVGGEILKWQEDQGD